MPHRGLKNRKDSHTKGSALTGAEISWDRKEASESQRRAQEPAFGRWAEQRETWTGGLCHCPELFSLRYMSMVQTRAGCWTWCLEYRPRERLSIGCTETAKRGWSVVRQQPRVSEEVWAYYRSLVNKPLLSESFHITIHEWITRDTVYLEVDLSKLKGLIDNLLGC